MAEDSDEDVVFTNSPLMQHLVDAGIDVHCETFTLSNEFKREDNGEEISLTYPYINKMKSWLSIMFGLLANVIGFTVLKEETFSMEDIYKEKLFLMAVKSKALETEDQQFLENFREKIVKHKQPLLQPFIKSKMIVMVALPCVLAYLYSRIVYPDLPWSYKTLTDLSAICTFLYILINLTKHFILCYRRNRIEIIYNVIIDCFKMGESVVKYTKKSLRLIQESELISRGFTLVSHKSPVSRLEQNSLHNTHRQCPQLRSTLFYSARNCFLVLKSATTNLVTGYPLDANIDSIMNYLCHIPIEEFGQCLQVTDDTKQLYTLTDGFSVASLKGVKHLCHLQQSEFLRRLTLTFLENTSSTFSDESEGIQLVKHLTLTLQTNNEKLQRSYNIHSCCVINQDLQSTRLPPSSVSPVSDVYVAVHSLDLHLQAALLRIRSLSTIMEHQIEKTEDSSEVSNQSDDSLLEQIKQELLACKGCWEEGLSRVENLLKSNDETEKADVINTVVNEPSIPKPILQCGVEDPVIEDQVFEAYNDEDEEESGESTWDEFLSPEEKEKKKKEKEEALRLLTELKSVISVRAQDTAKREEIALNKAKGGLGNIKTDNIESDNQTSNKISIEKNNVNVNTDGSLNDVVHNENRNMENVTDTKNSIGKAKTSETVNSDEMETCTNIEPVEMVIKPRKQKYVYCPPEDEMNSSTCTGNITGLQFIGLPVLGRQQDVEERLGRLSGANISFTSMLAAQAVAQSQRIGLNVQTFGDDNDYDDLIYDNNDSSEEDCKSRDSLNHDSDDDDSIENNPKNDDSLKDGQNFVDLNRDEFDDNDSLKDDYEHDLHDCYNLETCKNDSDDSLEINDSIENRISDEENDLIDTDFGAKNDQNIHEDLHNVCCNHDCDQDDDRSSNHDRDDDINVQNKDKNCDENSVHESNKDDLDEQYCK